MADVRSLLRSELASRRIKHPHVSYSSSGLAQCTVCNLQLKADALWEPHQRSKGHQSNLRKLQDGESSNGHVNKKRKVGSDEEDDEEGRKKVKSVKEPPEETGVEKDSVKGAINSTAASESAGAVQRPSVTNETQIPAPVPDLRAATSLTTPVEMTTPPKGPDPTTTAQPDTNKIDESEWAAFEREVAATARQNGNPSVLNSSATIIAAPISAAELAVQEELTKQRRTRREEETEAEKEDAARQLEEEFDEMDELEEKVRKLRQRREGLRGRSSVREGEESGIGVGAKAVAVAKMIQEDEPGKSTDAGGDEESEDDGDDEWDGWRFR
jgi:zinc finger protein 830